MNCKQGDLAIIVDADVSPQHIGKIVRCIRSGIPYYTHDRTGPWWVTEPELKNIRNNPIYWLDSHLRPIRPQSDDATDEMVKIVGKPHEVTA